MTRPTASEIRQQFIDFFTQKCGHTFVPSSPCVPLDDPTLMFANAGMNQFKDVFLATGTRPYSRAANTQKCIRAGGKHNDLDDVGHDTYHHTFFEMLGNWSFGDYFKKEAIEWAWELLTKVWGIDETRLHATYFEGSEADGLEPDEEAKNLWLSILPPERVHAGNKKDNFWEMGDVGPCGPCSEVHIDLTPDKSGAHLVNAGDARVIEIWNLVFIQFNRGPDGKLTPLPAKHVDTGMGFERLCAVLQGSDSNYNTDVWAPLFEAIRETTGTPAYGGRLESSPESGTAPSRSDDVMRDVAYRVVADHIRCLTFALTDGAIPSNEGRGYVLRRILRRAVRYGRQYLGMQEPFLHKLVSGITDSMGEAFPELRTGPNPDKPRDNPAYIAEIILDEEASFGKTLDRGIALFENAADYAVKHHRGRISGEDAFKLHDTYGFPIDLTELMAEERGLTVNIGEYERLMEEARDMARAAGKSSAQIALSVEGNLPQTDDAPKYEKHALATNIIGFVADNKWHDSGMLPADAEIGVVLEQTCAYAEAGGQIGDQGLITAPRTRFKVETTTLLGGTVVHVGHMETGTLTVGDRVAVEIDASRSRTKRNHTATHLLNWALRDVLGDHVQQKGSLVDPDKTRFDFSNNAALTEDELQRVEDLVNEGIRVDHQVYTQVVDQAEARKINTLRAVFGERYPDKVRVVSVGVPVNRLLREPENPHWFTHAVEFCGGTHVQRTSEILRFCLIEEGAVAKGIRRVTGITGERATLAFQAADTIKTRLAETEKLSGDDLPKAITALTNEIDQTELPIVAKSQMRATLAALQEKAKKIKKEQSKAGAAAILDRVDDLLDGAESVGDTKLIAADMGEATADQLRTACDALRSKAASAAILLAARNGDRVILLAAITKDAVGKGAKAGDLIKTIAPVVGGKGGGRPDMAQGGGTDLDKISDAVSAATDWLREKLQA